MDYLIRLLAFCLPMALFIFWGILGYATLSLLYTQRNLVQNLLLAPSVGLAITILPIFWLSYFGFPVIEFAHLVTLLLLATGVGLLCWLRPIIPLRRYWPFALILLMALFVTGYSLLQFGFAWLSYTNDDMTNYCLGALRFLHTGYYTLPDMQQLTQGRDYSLYYWFMYIPALIRAGSELLLAWVSAITGLMPDKIFMPLIIAMHLTLISVVGALVYTAKKWRTAALTVCALVTFSAMLNLGVFYQLIAQVVGLSLFSASAILLLRTRYPTKLSTILSHALLTAMVVSAFFIFYPEIVPILALTFCIYYFVFFVRGGKLQLPFVLFIGITTLIVLVLSSANIATFLGTLLLQFKHGFAAKVVLFPYFLIPSGLAEFWGFHAIGESYFLQPQLSIGITIGAILLIVAFIAAIRLTLELYSVAIITLIMLLMGVALFMRNSDFGLFKIAMYIQPFILSTLVIAWFKMTEHPLYRIAPFLLIVLAGIHGLNIYQKRGEGIGIFDIPGASQTAINVDFSNLLNNIPKSQQIVLDTPAVELAKDQMLYLRGRQAYFPSADFLGSMLNFGEYSFDKNLFIWRYFASNKNYVSVKNFVATAPTTATKLHFDLHALNHDPKVDNFEKQALNINKSAVLIASAPTQTVFNRRTLRNITDHDFIAMPLASVHNYLIFINSERAFHYYLGSILLDLAHISLYSLEEDYYYPDKTYAGIGRYLLFQVINPSQKMRLVFDTTATLMTNVGSKLPPAAVIGGQRELLPLLGRGSARVFSALITPQMIAHNPYIAIDMGKDGYYYSNTRGGLMNLYGAGVFLDARKMNAYARDISLVSEQQYENLQPPVSLSKFPADLANPDLEYSGIYEDGWISEASFFMLQQPSEITTLEVKGSIPSINNPEFKTLLSILIDGKVVVKKELVPGDFDITKNIAMGVKRRRVELRFSNTQILPGTDGRVVAAKIDFIGFKTN